MAVTAVVDGLLESLKELDDVHAYANAVGVSELRCAFRDPRDAALAQALFEAPAITVIEPETVSLACAEAPLVLRRTRRGGLIVLSEPEEGDALAV